MVHVIYTGIVVDVNEISNCNGTEDKLVLQAEDLLLQHGCRRRVYSILKCLRDSHMDFPNSPITSYILKTLILFECEKHPHELNWSELEMGDRIVGWLAEIACLLCIH